VTSVSTETPDHRDAPVLRLDIERDPEAPSLARAAVAGFCEGRGIRATTLATLRLLVSEIVTNAVIHPEVAPAATIHLCASTAPGAIRIEVTDAGGGFTPRPRDPARLDGGYGLYLVDQQAERWGVERQRGTTVWFEMTI
jgi:anti-sigma regulatory factor (Ser/Thr protein kinase)